MKSTTPQELAEALRALGVRAGDVLMVHSFLLALGRMEGGPDGAIAGLRAALTETGTLVMPSYTFSFCSGEPFDLERTPSETGALSEHFRKLPGMVRSLHPIQSVAAAGPLAEEACRHECKSSFGPGSSSQRMLQAGVRVLNIGVDYREAGFTFFHYVEEQEQVPYRFYKDFPGTITADGRTYQDTYKMYVRDLRYTNDFTRIGAILEAEELITTGHFAHGDLTLLETVPVCERVALAVREDPTILLPEGTKLQSD